MLSSYEKSQGHHSIWESGEINTGLKDLRYRGALKYDMRPSGNYKIAKKSGKIRLGWGKYILKPTYNILKNVSDSMKFDNFILLNLHTTNKTNYPFK